MVRKFVPINGVDAPADVQHKCVNATAKHFSLPAGKVKQIISNNVFMLLERDTIVEVSPGGKPKAVSKKTLMGMKDLRCLSQSTRPLYEHQIRVTETLQHQRSLLIVHSVGSGKTLTAMSAAYCFLENNPTGKVFLVTPVSLVENFREELIRSFRGKYAFHTNVEFMKALENERTFKALMKKPMFIAYTHAKFAKDLKYQRIPKSILEQSMVVIDEIHNYRTKIPKKAMKAQHHPGSKIPACFYVQQGIKPAQRVIGLTATPFVNDISDLTSIVSIVTGKDLFAKTSRKKSQLQLLRKYSKNIFSFYDIEKGDPRFPSYTIHKIELVMPKAYYEEYMKIERLEKRHFAGKTISDAFYGNIRVASNKIDNRTNSPKVLWTINKIETIIRTGGRVVVFSNFLDSGVKVIKRELSKKGVGCNFITGKVKRNTRQKIVRDYNSGNMPVLLISKAGGEGLDLKKTTAVIMLEPTWNSASRTQIFGRGIRNGSHLDLPESLRHVDCFILLMVKPKNVEDELVSGDRFTYDVTEDKHVASEALLDYLEDNSIEGTRGEKWLPEKQSYHILPVSGNMQLFAGPYGEEDEEGLSKKTLEILEEIEAERVNETIDDFFSGEAEEDELFFEESGDDEFFGEEENESNNEESDDDIAQGIQNLRFDKESSDDGQLLDEDDFLI
jgi:superfamily II DNA or RNA helicase